MNIKSLDQLVRDRVRNVAKRLTAHPEPIVAVETTTRPTERAQDGGYILEPRNNPVRWPQPGSFA